MRKKQIAIIAAVFALMAYLYYLPVVGLVKPKTPQATGPGMVAQAQGRSVNTNITVESVSETAKNVIGAGLSAKINESESRLKNTGGEAEKLKIQKELAKQWDDVNQAAPAAFYYLETAKKENKFDDWLNAGNRFNDAFKLTQDTSAQPVFALNATEAFQQALKLKPADIEAKTGLGIAYVNGGGTPMQGIGLLLEVVKQDPNNRKANLNLGMFSMKSGQFEKAVERFKTVIAQKPEVEPYFYLAESYKQLGMRKEAIAAYQKCKEMMPDPTFDQRIDEYIKELK